MYTVTLWPPSYFLAFFSADCPSQMPPDFPFIGTYCRLLMVEQNKKDKESGKWEEGGRSVSWELLAESGLQMLCPPEDSQLLSILDGVTQITVPLPPRSLPPTISAPQLHPSSERQSHE